jgi:hypothetical protein
LALRRRNLVLVSCVVFALILTLIVVYFTALRHEGGPLNLGTYPPSVGLGVNVGEDMTYGEVVMRNEGSQSIVVEDAELLTHDGGATVTDVRLLDADAVPGGSLVGVDFGFNPPGAAVRVAGAVMEPSHEARKKSYQLIFSIRVNDSGGTQFDAVRVWYRIGGRKYVTSSPFYLRLCTPRGVTCEGAPPAPPKNQ